MNLPFYYAAGVSGDFHPHLDSDVRGVDRSAVCDRPRDHSTQFDGHHSGAAARKRFLRCRLHVLGDTAARV